MHAKTPEDWLSPSEGAVVALILARGGSKSIPRKNLLPIGGKPLIAYSIETCLATSKIDRVIVSTDDEEIAEVARKYGADVPFMRPSELAQDMSPDIDAFRHALGYLSEVEKKYPSLLVHIRATTPSRDPLKLNEAIRLMQSRKDADCLRSVHEAKYSPYKMWSISGETLTPLLTVENVKEPHSSARQLLPKAFEGNGYVDIIRPATILDKNSMIGDVVIPFVLDEPIADLDYKWQIPELLVSLGISEDSVH